MWPTGTVKSGAGSGSLPDPSGAAGMLVGVDVAGGAAVCVAARDANA